MSRGGVLWCFSSWKKLAGLDRRSGPAPSWSTTTVCRRDVHTCVSCRSGGAAESAEYRRPRPAAPFEIPAGFRLASAPTAAQLEYRNAAAAQLVGKCILFNWQHDWQAAGWCLGKITRANTDGRIVREGVPANFFVYYEIDEEEAKHSLELVEHGHQEVPNAWVLFTSMFWGQSLSTCVTCELASVS